MALTTQQMKVIADKLIETLEAVDSLIDNDKEFNKEWIKTLEATKKMLHKMKAGKHYVLHSLILYRKHLDSQPSTPSGVLTGNNPDTLQAANLQPGAINTVLGHNHVYVAPQSGTVSPPSGATLEAQTLEWLLDTDEFPPQSGGEEELEDD